MATQHVRRVGHAAFARRNISGIAGDTSHAVRRLVDILDVISIRAIARAAPAIARCLRSWHTCQAQRHDLHLDVGVRKPLPLVVQALVAADGVAVERWEGDDLGGAVGALALHGGSRPVPGHRIALSTPPVDGVAADVCRWRRRRPWGQRGVGWGPWGRGLWR